MSFDFPAWQHGVVFVLYRSLIALSEKNDPASNIISIFLLRKLIFLKIHKIYTDINDGSTVLNLEFVNKETTVRQL